MHAETISLVLTAMSLGFIHTLLGPDHYVPFVALGRVRGWTGRRTLAITMLCGLGHIGSSVLLGLFGILLGIVVRQLVSVETVRGDIAAWLLIAFGLTYAAWGLRHALRHKSHMPGAERGEIKADARVEPGGVTPWALFLIFFFGPCEPLIPLLMYPASRMDGWAVVSVVLAFGATTLVTMACAVVLLRAGTGFIPSSALHRYAHALAGLAVLACGCLVKLGIA